MSMIYDMMKMKIMKTKTKRTKMEITSSPELTYGFLLLFSLVIFSFPNLSSSQSQYHSPPRNIEAFYPYWPPPPQQSPSSPSPSPFPSPYLYSPPPASLGPHPPPAPNPSQAPSSSPSKAIITAVGVTAASALVVAALLFLLLSRRRKSTRNDKPPPPAPIISQSRVTRAGGNVIVDEDGLDHLYWKELKKSQNGVSNNRSQIHPDPGARHRSTSVALQAVPDSGGNGSQPQPLEPVVADPSRGDIMEAMFGTVAKNRRSPGEENISRSIASESSDPDLSSKIFILDPKNSENIMALLRSIGMPCGKLIKALLEGKGMSAEGIVQLTSISTALTSDQVSEIRAYKGDPARLADAEAFLYAVLKAVPTAFARAERMLFWSHYDADILKLKESLQTLELACEELRSRGIILKLLQAIHSTGTRLCIGSLSEEAKAFKLSTLRKLCEYKSSDGKTTLLHFVVHQVVRNEGRRCFMARNSSMSRQNTNSSMTPLVVDSDTRQDDDLAAAAAAAKVEKEKEFLMLGLPIVGGLSSDFSNVKKAANMDYDGLKESLGSLVSRVREARRNDTSIDGGGGFEMEMRYLLESAEVETKAGQVEHSRVMSLVKKTAQYYQPEGGSNHKNPLQLFVILKDFLSMIDQTCVDIARNLQQNQVVSSDLGSDSSQPDNGLRSRVNFPGIPLNFFSDTPIGNVGDDS